MPWGKEQRSGQRSEATIPSRYDQPVVSDAPNNCHAFALTMVGCGKRVLELGAASGHVTRALVARQCAVTAVEYDAAAAADLEGIAERVVVGDLNHPATLSNLEPGFEVILAGDVLEHLIDPHAVLARAAQLLAPEGRVVISLPHVGHVDVRLALLSGRFDYRPWGLLDRTHLRFFTIDTIREMVHAAGLSITELKRVRMPAFATELGIDRNRVSGAILDEILDDPEAESYQFVFTATRSGDGGESEQRAIELDRPAAALSAGSSARKAAQALASTQARRIDELSGEVASLRHALDVERARREATEAEVNAVRSGTLFRLTAWPRAIYGALLKGGRLRTGT